MEIVIYCISFAVVLFAVFMVIYLTAKNKKVNKTSEVLYELLPNLNCKKCGRKDCLEFAVDLSKGKTVPTRCPYLSYNNMLKCRQILKRERIVNFDSYAFVKCKGGKDCENKFDYYGDKTCASLNLKHNGNKYCPYACLGCGDCVRSCVYGAIKISEKGCAVIDREKCIACGECISACPNHLISLISNKEFVEVVCSNKSDNYEITKNCKVACNHCESCVVACPTGAIKMVGNIPRIDRKKCVKCGKCVSVCPNHTISRL